MQTAANMMTKALRTGKRDLERAVMICFTAWILPKSLPRWHKRKGFGTSAEDLAGEPAQVVPFSCDS